MPGQPNSHGKQRSVVRAAVWLLASVTCFGCGGPTGDSAPRMVGIQHESSAQPLGGSHVPGHLLARESRIAASRQAPAGGVDSLGLASADPLELANWIARLPDSAWEDVEPLLPRVVELLSHADEDVALNAAMVLGGACLEQPAYIRALVSSAREVRGESLFGVNAAHAIASSCLQMLPQAEARAARQLVRRLLQAHRSTTAEHLAFVEGQMRDAAVDWSAFSKRERQCWWGRDDR